ncbi:MAG: TetR family transcriptional regulator [Micavibrio sp.]|nr:TetR family transcriptional regulator [Micavibrio sp.]|tara:strand:+ start:4340 stop:4960 length:621 start_codon:yes stop_codon:yes gene_type:complete
MRRTKEDAEQTRQDILNAATQMFCNKGVSKTTLEDIARTANVTRGAIYWHFSNKKQIFDTLFENLHQPLLEIILDDLEKDHPNPLDQLKQLCIKLLQDLEIDIQKQQAIKLFLIKCDYSGDLEEFKDKHAQQKIEKQKAFCRYFEKAQKKGTLPANADPKLLTLSINCYMKGIAHEYLENPNRFKMKKDAHRLMQIFFQGLGNNND